MSKINKLTPEQEKGISEWREHCLKIGRDTSPINKELTEQSWEKFYKILGFEKPTFWYCQSPLQAQIIINMFPKIVEMFKVKDKGTNIKANIENNILTNILANIGTNIGDDILTNIGDNIRDNIGNNILTNIWDNIRDNILDNIGDNIEANIEDNIEDNIWTNIWDNIRANIRDNIGNNIGANIGDNIRDLKLKWIDTYSWGQHDISWIAYYKYYEKYKLLPKDKNLEIIDTWYDLACSCGWCYTFKNMVFVCEKPSKLHLNNRGQLHNEKGMALEYSDGYGLWMLNGARVSKELVLTPAEELDANLITKEQNAEIRREIVRKIGIERVCQKLNSKTIDMDGDYELLILDLGDDRRRPYLKMKNPSIQTYHIEGVSPEIKTVEEALNWRNGTKIRPSVLT